MTSFDFDYMYYCMENVMTSTLDATRARDLAAELYDRFVMGGWEAHEGVETIMQAFTQILAQAGEVRNSALEEAANVAKAHRGAGERKRRLHKKPFNGWTQEVYDEERGEDIAAEIIARHILELKTNPPDEKRSDDGLPTYHELLEAVYIYQQHTGQSLEDTLAGKWTNTPAQPNQAAANGMPENSDVGDDAVYHGNSVWYWWNKAQLRTQLCNKGMETLRKHGLSFSEGKDFIDVLSDALTAHTAVVNAERTVPEMPDGVRLERISQKYGNAVCTIHDIKTMQPYTADAPTIRAAVEAAIAKIGGAKT